MVYSTYYIKPKVVISKAPTDDDRRNGADAPVSMTDEVPSAIGWIAASSRRRDGPCGRWEMAVGNGATGGFLLNGMPCGEPILRTRKYCCLRRRASAGCAAWTGGMPACHWWAPWLRPRAPDTAMRWAYRIIGFAVLAAGVALASGFLWFLHSTSQSAGPIPDHADGIVALTGGPGRVETALHLLVDGRADRLLITGIGGRTDLGTLGRLAGLDLTAVGSRITLGRYAASTRGNGVEAAAWARSNNIASLIVVTAGFHMPRALAELHSALPGVTLIPMPVQFPGQRLLAQGPHLRQEAEEYAKYLLTISGLSAWMPRREGNPALPAHEGTAG